jgi:hypothetical protein
MLVDFAIHAIGSFSEGQAVASVWWVLAIISGIFLFGEKVVVRRRRGNP